MKKKMVASKIQSELSIERTAMANRRTFLAYIRSAIGLIVAGAGLLKFTQSTWWVTLGIVMLVLTPIVLVMGIIDYMKVSKLIAKEKEFLSAQYDEESVKTEINEAEDI